MNYKKVISVISDTDRILDTNPKIRVAGEKILKLLIKNTESKGGGILIYDFNEKKLKILAKSGRLLKKPIKSAFERGEKFVKKKEIAFPITLEKMKLGVIYLYGKNYTDEEISLISGSENILDGKLKHEKESKELKTIFKRYIGENAMKKILKLNGNEELLGKSHNCSILFADVNNFTEYSANKNPKTVVKFLNKYFSEMSKIAFKNGGTIDKFIGDAIMVIFGSPVSQKDHAKRAIKTAKDMVKSAKPIINEFEIPKGGLSIGIATGKVIAGNIGSEKMMDYTVIGKKVNLASRLTSIAGKNEIFIDENTKKKITMDYKEIGKIKIKGLEPTKVFKILLTKKS